MTLHEIGFKMSSGDVKAIPSAIQLYRDQYFDYIELYINLNTYYQNISKWKDCNIPYIIHGPHNLDNINLGQKEKRNNNLKAYEEVKKYADTLKSEIIIVHSGHNGDINESISQINKINDSRICIENKPKKGLTTEICIGHSFEEIQLIINSIGNIGFVLDIGHAVYASNSHGIYWEEEIEAFMKFNPMIYHFNDGDISSEKDVHLNLGKGSFDLQAMFNKIKKGSKISLETPRKNGIEDFILDVEYIRRLSE